MRNSTLQLLILTFTITRGVTEAAPLYHFVYTGQTGAQTQIDSTHSSTWTFTLQSGSFDLGGGKLDMKDGPQTIDSVTLSVWRTAVGPGGTLLHALTHTNASFGTNHTPPTPPQSASQQFGQTVFQFGSPGFITLTAPGVYIVQLTSAAPDQQAKAYFIKGGGSGTFLDEGGNPLPPGITITGGEQQGGSSLVPEPSTWALTGIAVLALAWRRQLHSSR